MRWIAFALCVGWAGCDGEYRAEEDGADTAGGEGDVGSEVAGGWSRPAGLRGAVDYGADPESGAFVEGAASYTPRDAALAGAAVRLGGAMGPTGFSVIAIGGAWDGGPIVASAGSDAVIEAAAGLADPGAETVAERAAESGRWMVVGGRVVIVEGPAVEVSWAARAPREDRRPASAGEAFVAELPVALTRLPEEVRSVRGAEVRVFDATREVCIARVAELVLEARLVHEAFGPWEPRYSEREVLARGLRAVVATLEPLAGGPEACAGGVVAVGVQARSPALFSEVEVAPSLRRKAIAATCAAPAWQALARQDEDGAPLRPWSRECKRLSLVAEVRRFATRAGGAFVLVSSDGVHAGFHMRGGRLESAWTHVTDATPAGILDVQGDGTPELVLAPSYRAPTSVVGLSLAGDLSEPTFLEDFTPVPPRRLTVGGFGVPDYSVFRPR